MHWVNGTQTRWSCSWYWNFNGKTFGGEYGIERVDQLWIVKFLVVQGFGVGCIRWEIDFAERNWGVEGSYEILSVLREQVKSSF